MSIRESLLFKKLQFLKSVLNKDYIAQQCFAYLYEKVYKTYCPDAVLNSDKSLVAYRRFAINIKDQGVDFIWFYCIYQFGRYIDKIENNELRVPGGKVTPQMIFGERPYQVFVQRRSEMDWITLQNPIIVNYKASKQEFAIKKGIEIEVSKPQSLSKDPIKRIASSGIDPLETCIDMTGLYNENDISCQRCVDKTKCLEMKQKLYNR